mmetsp:Transcript_6176/g.11006  ORF Transcript_6176/g.11006 Transcript_6176/m.11006 type:complete len:272 (-) Transcript_6176:1490-2305(-)
MGSSGDQISSLPEGYVVPKVWAPKEVGGTFGAMNRPTAGARFETKLPPKGKADYQLFSLGTPNGMKVTILLEELGVDYDLYKIDISKQDQFGSGFVSINPNSKIPALLDYSDGNETNPIRVFESANIMLRIAEQQGKFIPTDPRKKTEMMNWLFWLQGSAPYIGGGFGHFVKYAPIKIEYAIDRFTMECKRLLDVLDQHLASNEFVAGDEYTIADMCILPWAMAPEIAYKSGEFVQFESYQNIHRWSKDLMARPAVQRGIAHDKYVETPSK